MKKFLIIIDFIMEFSLSAYVSKQTTTILDTFSTIPLEDTTPTTNPKKTKI